MKVCLSQKLFFLTVSEAMMMASSRLSESKAFFSESMAMTVSEAMMKD